MQLKAVLLSYTETKINREQTSFSVRTTLTAISNCFPLQRSPSPYMALFIFSYYLSSSKSLCNLPIH